MFLKIRHLQGVLLSGRVTDPRALGGSKGAVVLLIAAVAGALLLSSGPASAGCLRFGQVVTLVGHYMPGVLADNGNPDPLSIPGRTSDLLLLDERICIFADALSKAVPDAEDVQLRCPDRALTSGEHVALKGRLFGGLTGNGHTPIILACRDDD